MDFAPLFGRFSDRNNYKMHIAKEYLLEKVKNILTLRQGYDNINMDSYLILFYNV